MEKSIMESSKTSSQRIRKYYTAETMFDGWKKNLRLENFSPINKIDPKKQKRILNGTMPVKIKVERQ